ncbi:ABC transporter substrate-binding protein [Pseudohalocynthiibacter aestuariivivens]|uniref:ABC transporter substrate-binding protein n=1 Tax=Roseovarius pelagicus TaxID=2980108 RepID=A0ABY6DDA6_9RHOB|nr:MULTISPECIES: ABC transporter substrate-binding protein [Rhodobacterales]MBW4976352.1 ABC transporter substrate-binding protein [Roseovarius mucosus]QIE44925.1 ABC transporter substrate-binding protein [Pseudohalocynthiibacter aestuariivivens]UXX83178.1 ABC transporter substrate-binding protein [Roseovarius pelagicus]
MRLKNLATATAVTLTTMAGMVSAETATIGVAIAPSTLDPQLSLLTSDVGIYRHIYGSLVKVDSNNQVVLDLATAYRPIDDLTWEFKLREDVTFHDGSDFDANDVVFTLERLGTVPGHDGLAAQYVAPIIDIEIVDPHTILMKTNVVTPDVAKRMAQISIISNQLDKDVTSAQFNSGDAAIGTGPFKYVDWQRGDRLVLDRNDAYWDTKSAFERVVLRTMTNPATRVAALEAGDLDMVDNIPPLDAQRLMDRDNVTVTVANSGRAHFLQFDSTSEVPPLTFGADGAPLTENPYADIRVREALSLAISRDLIVDRIMDGFAASISQGVPEGLTGFAPDIPLPGYDVERAKALLAEAGYPDGFSLTLGCPNDRYVNDAALCQAIGQMWSRIGMDVTVDTSPKAVYFKKMLAGDFPAHYLAWGNTAGDSISFLKSVVGTPNKEHGRGSNNRSFSNADLDVLIDKAASTVDEAERIKLLQEVMTIAVAEHAFLPMHVNNVIAATRKGLTYTPQMDENTNALSLRKE